MWYKFVQCHSQHKSQKSVAELEKTVIAMKRVVEKLQQENKRLMSGRKDSVMERKVSVSVPQCRVFWHNVSTTNTIYCSY
jgi:hypothetical protein